VALPPKPPPKPGLTSAPEKEDALQRSRREKDELEANVQAVEEDLEALKARYDQYFLGIERREPNRWRDELKKKVLRLKTAFTRNTGLKFRIESLNARFLSYERLWLRSAREKEEGTYHRDLFKARLHRHGEPPVPQAKEPGVKAAEEAAAPAAAAPAATQEAPAKTRTPAPAPPPATAAKPPPLRPPPPPVSSGGAMSEPQMRALYNAYLAAKMTCREDVSKLTYEAVAKTIAKQVPELMSRYKAKSVDFKVEVKDGRAILKAIPKV
jgi:hypothetical protein